MECRILMYAGVSRRGAVHDLTQARQAGLVEL
jgi:hypothetical protein